MPVVARAPVRNTVLALVCMMERSEDNRKQVGVQSHSRGYPGWLCCASHSGALGRWICRALPVSLLPSPQ